ncbi:MAG: hypothetical protein IGS03_01855 [Candidatus Sericytochromatia bacterium]|nr:hypothetical protein [Candidatus Sericytochromatia bacterium]
MPSQSVPLLSVAAFSDASSLDALPFFLLGLRQQDLAPEAWELHWCHRGPAEGLQDLLQRFESQTGACLQQQLHCFPAETSMAEMLNPLYDQLQGQALLLLDSTFQPHNSLLKQHLDFQSAQAYSALGVGSSQFHPEQALTLLGLAVQQNQLLFNFYPIEQDYQLSYTATRFHNLSLPRKAWLPIEPGFQSLRFGGWDLGLRCWRAGLRPWPLPLARSCASTLYPLDSLVLNWQNDCQQDLASFLNKHPFPMPSLKLAWPQPDLQLPDLQTLKGLKNTLAQQQHRYCVPIEPGDKQDQFLQQWSQQLAVLWRGLALHSLHNQKPARLRWGFPFPWQGLQNPDPGSLWQVIAAHCPEAQSDLNKSSEPPPHQLAAIQCPEGPFDLRLRQFLALTDHLQPGCLMLMHGQQQPQMQRLAALIQQAYPWFALEQWHESILLCYLGSDAVA